MSDLITRTEFNQLRQEIAYIAEGLKIVLSGNVSKEYVNQKQAMEMLGCGETKLKELRKEGKVRYKHIGRKVMISVKSIQQYNREETT